MKKAILLLICFACALPCALTAQVLVSCDPDSVPPGYNGVLAITGMGTRFHRSTQGINLKLIHHQTGQAFSYGITFPGHQPWTYPFANDSLHFQGNLNLPGNANPGYYKMELRGYGGMKYYQNMYIAKDSILLVYVPVGVAPDHEATIGLAPNPAQGLVRVTGLAHPCDVEVIDAAGRRLLRSTLRDGGDALDVSALPSGLYFLRLHGQGLDRALRLEILH